MAAAGWTMDTTERNNIRLTGTSFEKNKKTSDNQEIDEVDKETDVEPVAQLQGVKLDTCTEL